ncbi:MAG: TetR/AcrR family transcriptional regulator [Micropruina sp.]|uniref:TetR/AcrR family transcriptional regulator n=1 Tax=Micropruina sp. TaxID=2737536 RepID=UPI0039E5C543
MARRPRGQLRREILDTVIELLIDTGEVESVSIDAVVERVGCTPPALYYYFPTKTDLLRQACDVEFGKLADVIEEGVADVAGGSLARLARRGQTLLHWASEHPALYRVLFMGSGRQAVMSGDGVVSDPSLRAMAGNIQTAINEGLVVPQDVRLLTLTLWGVTHGYASLAVSFPTIPLSALDSALALAVEAVADRILTPAGQRSWAAFGRRQAGETVSSGEATGP